MKLLLNHRAAINAKNIYKKTPLHMAAFWKRPKTTQILIHQHAELDARDIDNATPLHLAAYVGAAEITQHLITNGANINTKTNNHETPYDFVQRGQHNNTHVMHLRNVDQKDYDQVTAFIINLQQLQDGNIDSVINDETPQDYILSYLQAAMGQGLEHVSQYLIRQYATTPYMHHNIAAHAAILHKNGIHPHIARQCIQQAGVETLSTKYLDDTTAEYAVHAFQQARYKLALQKHLNEPKNDQFFDITIITHQ